MKKIFFLGTIFAVMTLLGCTATKEVDNKEVATTTPKTETMERPPRPERGERPQRSEADREERRQQMEERNKQMIAELGLDEAQTEKYNKINQKYRMAFQNARQANEGDREGMMMAMRDLREKQNKEIKSILTEEQYKKYEEMQQARRGQRGGGRGF